MNHKFTDTCGICSTNYKWKQQWSLELQCNKIHLACVKVTFPS